MTLNADIQKLEPGALIELYELDASIVAGGSLRFHANPGGGTIWWQGKDYAAWPIQADGFARTTDQQPTPKLRVGNVDGSISLLCIMYDDLLGCTIKRHRTFAQYLDAVNFPGGVNPSADPTQEFPVEAWFIERKSVETFEVVEFELASPLDFNGVKLPRRQIIANYCPFEYRGPLCGYTGVPVADILDNPVTTMADDVCGHRPRSCKLRKWPDGVQNYGGFPAAGLART